VLNRRETIERAAGAAAMTDAFVNRKLRWWTLGALFALILGGNAISLAQQKKADILYYRRVAIDTEVSHASTNAALKARLDEYVEVRQISPDELEVKIRQYNPTRHNYEGSFWKIQPAAGRATFTATTNRNEGGLEVAWSVPPEYLRVDTDTTLWITVSATRKDANQYLIGGAVFGESVAETFEPGADKTVVGKNPFGRIAAGNVGDWLPSAEGRITVRPKRNQGPFFINLNLDPAGEGLFNVHYHYEPVTSAPPNQPQPPQPPKSSGCERTFGKEWGATWGKFIVRLDGNRASGTYTNRDGNNGPGTFTGTVTGNTLDARWKDDSGKWEGTFRIVLSDDGCSFSNTGFTVNPPGPGSGPTGKDGPPPPTVPPSPPPPGGTDDPPFTPNGQDCIDQWLRLAMSILNRRDKSNAAPNGPWRVSEYGTLVGHGVKPATNPPDGWDTTWHRNRYAYIWANWQQTHLEPGYGGELPPLKDFVEKCVTQKGGSTPPGPPTTGYPPGTNTNTPMTLLAEDRRVQAGETVVVPVWLVNGADVANINFTVGYQGSVARPEGDVGKGNLLSDAIFSANPKDEGLIRLGFAQSKGLSGTGTVAYLRFRAFGKPGDRTPLRLEVQIINNPAGTVLTIAKIDGSITIVGPDGLVPGDCDGDGALTSADAMCALNMSVKLIPEKLNMDMDGDGQVTSRDATIILQRRAMFLAKGQR
jgi:hypothetical protein